MPEITEQALKKQMETGELRGLYVLHGEEKYLLCRSAHKLLQRAAGENFVDFNLQKFDGTTTTVDQIIDAAEALPFMAEQKCVAVSDFNVETRTQQEVKKFTEWLETLPETTVLVLYLSSVEIDYKKSSKWKSFLSKANQLGTTVAFPHKSAADVEKLLCAAAAKRGCELSRSDAGKMVAQCGNNLQILFNELEKLCAFAKEGKITREHLEQVLTKNLETTVFLLSKALVGGEYDKAYQMLDLLFYQNEEPVMILAVLSSAYVDMYRVRAIVQSGQAAKEAARYFDYKGKEFRLRNAERDGAGLSMERLRQSLEILLQTDVALKSSRTDNRILMEEMIARLLLISQKEGMA